MSMPSEPLVIAIVLGTFGLLFVRRIGLYPLSRSITAAVGAVVVILSGALSPSAALASIDTGTILLLFGMLAHVEALAQSGFYRRYSESASGLDPEGESRKLNRSLS